MSVCGRGGGLGAARLRGIFVSGGPPSPLFFTTAPTLSRHRVNGVSQETCRDFGHTAYGLASTFNVAETALIQGVDLYTPNLKRLHSALEFHTALLVAGAANGWPKDPYHKPPLNISRPLVCNGSVLGLSYSPTYQVGLAAMQRVGGLALPATVTYEQQWVWRLPGSDMMGQYMTMYEPLTHGAPAPAAPGRPGGGRASTHTHTLF